MTDKKDDYYQPWLRDAAPTPAPAPVEARDASPEGGLAKPREVPPIGLDMSRYPAEERPPRKSAVDTDRLKAGAGGLWRAVRNGGIAFADWTIRVGEKADVPTRVEAMEIPRRAREIAGRSAEGTARAAKAFGAGTASAGRAAGAASGRLWQKMALGDKVGKLSSDAQRGLEGVAGKAGEALGHAAKAGKDSLGDAATKLRPAPREEAVPPPSGLEQLLAREAAEAATASRPAAPDLPLFAGEPGVELAAPKPAKAAKAAAAPPPPSVSAPAPDDRMPYRPAPPGGGSRGDAGGGFALPAPGWIVAAVALLLLAGAFWLGGRFGGGGLSKSEVETVVADYIRTHPEIIPEALEAQRNAEMAKAIDAIRPALEKPYAGAWAGNADGDVTLVVFTDYACGFCRASLPDIDRLVREDRRIKVVFRELPIIAPQSREAAIMALAAARQGKYDAFHHAMFASNSLSPGAIAAAAEKAGVVTDGSADATANEALFQRELDSNLAIASQLQLNATPTWVVGDQLMQGQIGYDALKRAVAQARKG